MKNIFVTIPESLHTEYKVACSKLGLSMRDPIVQFVTDFVAARNLPSAKSKSKK